VRTREVDTGPQGDPNPEVRLATLVVGGTPIDSAALQARLLQPAGQPDTIHPTVAEIAALPITRQRTMVFSETDDGNTFFINGQQWSETRDDVTVTLGDVEEWTIQNVSGGAMCSTSTSLTSW
jgi:FtsP/CotA-like multicopper oxidase with cupredoxin domain